MEVLVFGGSLASLWLTSSGLFACLDFGPCPLFLFLSLSWVFSFYDVWQGFIRCFYWGHAQWSIKISNGPINMVLLKKEVMSTPYESHFIVVTKVIILLEVATANHGEQTNP